MRRILCILTATALLAIAMQAALSRDDVGAPYPPWGRSDGGAFEPMATTVYPWPMYTHDETHSSLTRSPSPDDASVYWFNSTGPTMYGSPTIAEGKVFIGMGSGTGDSVMAFYVNNGTLVWKTRTDAPVSGGNGVSSTPAYSNGLLFFAADKIYALYASNGTVKWRFSVTNTWWGSGTPTVAQGKVFVGAVVGSLPDRWLHVLDQNSGQLIWRFQTQNDGGSNYGLFSPPAVWGNWVYLAGCDGYVYQINITQSGTTASYFHRSTRFLTMYGSPLIFDNKVYIGDGYTGPDSNARFRALSTTDLSVVWTFTPPTAGSFFSSAASAYNKIFVGSTNGYVYALDPWTRAIIWSYYTNGVIWSSPAISDGKVFIGSESNNLYSFNANQTNPATARWIFNTYGNVDSSPAISDGRVCVGTFGNGGRIYCIGSGITPPVNNPPTISLTSPGGASDWTGGTMHLVSWTVSDDTTPVDSLVVYLNYTSTPSSGVIAGPLTVATFYGWTVPAIDANDVLVNATVIDANGLKGYSTALVPKIDSVQPVVVSASPTGTGVALNTLIVIQFSESMNTASVEGVFMLVPNAGPLSYSWSQTAFPDDTVTIDHMDFQLSTTYTATVYTGARDASDPGIELFIDYIWSFTTIVNALPTVSISAPAGGESWTGGTIHNIDWTASDFEDPAASLMVWINYSVTGGAPFDHPIAGLQGVAGDSSPYAWTVPLEDSTTVVFRAAVIDTMGGTGYGSCPLFEIDSTPPQVSSTSPFSGESGVPTSVNVIVNWSELMNTLSAESSFLLEDTATWTPVPGSFSWAGNVMTFDPTSQLMPGMQYSANFSVNARDDSQPGNILALPYSWTFTTAATADTTAPTLMDATAIPDPQEVYLPVNVSAIVQDNVAVGLVSLSVTDPIGGTSNTTMQYDSVTGRYYLERAYNLLGIFAYGIWALDTSGNPNTTSGQFEVVDRTAPLISDLRAVPNPVALFSQTNLSAIVTDNYRLDGVWVEVTAPDLTVTNQSMSPGARYYFNSPADQVGTYNFKVSANDSSDNWNSMSSQFSAIDTTVLTISDLRAQPDQVDVFSQTNLSAIVTGNDQSAGVWVVVTAPDLTATNHSMSLGARYYFSTPADQLGIYNFRVLAANGSGHWGSASSTFTSVDRQPPLISHTPVSSWLITDVVNITATVTDNVHVQEVRLNFTDTAGASHNVSMSRSQQDEYFYVVPTQTQVGTLPYYLWAVDQSGNGAKSVAYSASIVNPKPGAPTSLVATLESCNSVRLRWVAPTTNEDGSPIIGLAGYNVYRSGVAGTQGTRMNANPVQGTTYINGNLGSNTRYYYTVKAVNSLGVESESSREVSATTPATCNTAGKSNDSSTLIWIVVLAIALAAVFSIIAIVLVKRRKKEEIQAESKTAPGAANTDEGKKQK